MLLSRLPNAANDGSEKMCMAEVRLRNSQRRGLRSWAKNPDAGRSPDCLLLSTALMGGPGALRSGGRSVFAAPFLRLTAHVHVRVDWAATPSTGVEG